MKNKKDKNRGRGVRKVEFNPGAETAAGEEIINEENTAPEEAAEEIPAEEAGEMSAEEGDAVIYSDSEHSELIEPAEPDEEMEALKEGDSKNITLDDLTDIDPDLLTGKTSALADDTAKKARLRGVSR